MGLEVWLKSGKKVTIGGRELWLMPLPLTRLYSIGSWLETNATEVLKEAVAQTKAGEVPNTMALVAKILLRVDVAELAFTIFNNPKDPETRERVNKGISKEFFEDYLDLKNAHTLFMEFVQLNDIENLIKNLQSLPMVKKLMEASSLTFGIPFLNSLPQSIASAQIRSEGSRSHRSTDTLMPLSEENLDQNPRTNQNQNSKVM